jgi:adenylate kinase
MNLIFLGPPGAGKGTIAVKVRDYFHIPHISTGDLFRSHIREKTELGQRVQAILDRGELVPDEITIEMVKQRLGEGDTGKGFILDGFPRTIVQAETLQNFTHISGVLNFELPRQAIIRRLSGRRIAKASGRVYHIDFNPPKVPGKCDETGEDLIQRPDDQPEAIRKRLEVYEKQTFPLIEFYRSRGLLIPVNAEPDPETVFQDVKNKLDRL